MGAKDDNNIITATQTFHKSYEILINDSRLLTSYHKEIAKWQLKQYDNKTMILVTELFAKVSKIS